MSEEANTELPGWITHGNPETVLANYDFLVKMARREVEQAIESALRKMWFGVVAFQPDDYDVFWRIVKARHFLAVLEMLRSRTAKMVEQLEKAA